MYNQSGLATIHYPFIQRDSLYILPRGFAYSLKNNVHYFFVSSICNVYHIRR